MASTDPDIPELDPSPPVQRLAHLIQHAAELQVRLCLWRVTGSADFDALQGDVRGLTADVGDLSDEITYERRKMGL